MKLLVYETEVFFDGHGDYDEGHTRKFISENENLQKINEEAFYDRKVLELENDEDIKDYELAEDCLYPEDGYNFSAYIYDFKPLTEEQAEEIQAIIESYERI